jgi:hypothetical protein
MAGRRDKVQQGTNAVVPTRGLRSIRDSSGKVTVLTLEDASYFLKGKLVVNEPEARSVRNRKRDADPVLLFDVSGLRL